MDIISKDTEASYEHSPNTEGTTHQSVIGPKPTRKHFFSPLDSTYADAVHKDAETVQFTPEEDNKVKRKIDNRVLPLIVCSYVFNQFDRTNIGNAHVLDEFNENFGITTNAKWTLALSVFYVGYCLLEMPANGDLTYLVSITLIVVDYPITNSPSTAHWCQSILLSLINMVGHRISLVRIRERLWSITRSAVSPYCRSHCMFYVFSRPLSTSVLLGIGEAGYYAGMIYYLSFWYRRHELAMRISLCMTGTLPGAIGGLVAFGLVRVHSPVLKGWQFLFLIEAIPTLLMALAILLFLPSFPFSATFLTPRERAIAQARLNRDHKPTSHGGVSGWQSFKLVINDVHAWMFMIVYASFNVGVATVSYFLPTLIKGLGFSSINAQGMTVAPYIVGWFLVFLQAWNSDRTKDRGYHVMASCACSFVGYLILATTAEKSVGAAYFALFLVVGGNYSLFPLVMSWAANTFSPTSKRGVGTAFIVSVSNCVSIASPQIYFDAEDRFRKGHAISAACLFLSFCVAFALRTRLSRMNKRNALMAQEFESDKAVENQSGEIADSDYRYVFMT